MNAKKLKDMLEDEIAKTIEAKATELKQQTGLLVKGLEIISVSPLKVRLIID